VLMFMKDQNGRFVIQKCIECIDPVHLSFVTNALKKVCYHGRQTVPPWTFPLHCGVRLSFRSSISRVMEGSVGLWLLGLIVGLGLEFGLERGTVFEGKLSVFHQ